jgi:hypothetical protein
MHFSVVPYLKNNSMLNEIVFELGGIDECGVLKVGFLVLAEN